MNPQVARLALEEIAVHLRAAVYSNDARLRDAIVLESIAHDIAVHLSPVEVIKSPMAQAIGLNDDGQAVNPGVRET